MRFLLPVAAALALTTGAEARSALDRDLQDYATAACLAHVDDPRFKEQGEAWAGAIVQRSHGDIEVWKPVADAAAAELARSGVGVARRDGPVGSELPVPIQSCAEIWDRPAVQKAAAAARAKLARAYGAAR